MSDSIPDGIEAEHIRAAIKDLDLGVGHLFAQSTRYDVLYHGKRYPPKAVVGLAAEKITGKTYGPYDFKGGVASKCFRVLRDNGFFIIAKGDVDPFPGEVNDLEAFVEGAVERVLVNRYERDLKARAKTIKHFGATCQVCSFDFEAAFGRLGSGFIHVHHKVPLAAVAASYVVDPVNDLIPVCPNCHAMLHRRTPPFSVEELRSIAASATVHPGQSTVPAASADLTSRLS